jgi:hypothetical protein
MLGRRFEDMLEMQGQYLALMKEDLEFRRIEREIARQTLEVQQRSTEQLKLLIDNIAQR